MKRPPVVRFTVRTLADVDLMEADNDRLATDLVERLRKVAASDDAMRVLDEIGCGRFDPEGPSRRRLLLQRYSRQLLTMRVCARALRWLMENHPEAAPYRLKMGAEGCASVRSRNQLIAAEVTTNLTGDGLVLMAKGAFRLMRTPAERRLSIFSWPTLPPEGPRPASATYPGVEILSLGAVW